MTTFVSIDEKLIEEIKNYIERKDHLALRKLVDDIRPADYRLGSIVALSLILIILNSGFLGAAVPLALKRFNIDPALATGPFVTTSSDILSLFIYLGLVTLFLQMTT